jgi:hypothetical protein
MGNYTGTTGSERLSLLMKNRTDSDATDPANLLDWLNQAYRFMCHPSVHSFREMQQIDNITLVTGDNDYSITTLGSSPANTVVAVRWVTFIDATSFTNTAKKRKLGSRSIRSFEERTLSTGQPVEYAIDGEVLFISGVPRSNENRKLLRVGYYMQPTALAADTTTVLTDYFDRPLVKFAQAFAEDDLGDRAASLVTLRSASRLMDNAESEMQLEAEDGGRVEVVTQSAMGI